MQTSLIVILSDIRGLSLCHDLLKFLAPCAEKNMAIAVVVVVVYDTVFPNHLEKLVVLKYRLIVLGKHLNDSSLCIFGILGQLTHLPARMVPAPS